MKFSHPIPKSFSNLLAAILGAIVFLAGFGVIYLVFRRQPALIGLCAALLTGGLIFAQGPLHLLAQRLAQSLGISSGAQLDPNRVLREYSLSLSSVINPDLLATTAIGLISEAVEIRRGFLFFVNHEKTDSQDNYLLRCPKGMGEDQPVSGTLSSANPIVAYFSQTRRPIGLPEIDHLQGTTARLADEKDWIMALKTELFIPVHARDEWIGLIALGGKLSGERYTAEELWLLGTMADQTAVALQNARLVESLMRVNNDFRRAYTALEQSNRQLEQSNRQLTRTHVHLEKLDQAKSEFISISSHELRTPLTVIRGYTEMLLDEPSVQEDPLRAKMVTGIHSGILRLHEIVDSMLDMASIDNRTMKLSVVPVSPHALVRTVCDNLEKSATDRNLTLEISNEVTNLPRIEGDPEVLRKVFYHLIINAIKYTPDGGKITIMGAADARGQRGYPNESIEIVVSDTGIGIEPEYHELIFTKFYQTGELALHSTGRTKFKGSGPGLGLSVSKGIVEAHGGLIWVESTGYDEELCPGSQFHVILPLKQKG